MTHSQPNPTIPTWRFCWELIRFQPGRFLYNCIGFSLMSCSWLIPGLVLQQFFNLISGDAPVRFDFWTLMALLVAGTVARIGGMYGMIKANIPYTYRAHTLLHKNMFSRIFELPGAAALPESTGATIGRFRDDVNELPWFTLWINNLIGFGLFALVATGVMLSINPLLTVVAFAPLVVIVLAAHAGTRRIERYRTQTRHASSVVTGYIAEIFAAVQAVKVARAERHVVARFAELNERRRQAALLDRLFEELLESIFVHAGNLGTGIILLLSAQAIGKQGFVVGDFALFVYFLGFFTDFIGFGLLLGAL